MKILIAGLGSIGQRHLRNLRTLLGDSVDILAHRVVGRDHVISEAMAIVPDEAIQQKYGVRSFARLEEALAEQPDAVFVCNPTSQHVKTAMAALAAGCHVFVEKPLSNTIDGVDALIELAERKKLVAAAGYQMRCHPALQRARQLLCDGAIGGVTSVRAEMGEYLPDAHPYEDYRISYAARAELGGGVLLCFIHEFDYLCWMFGTPARVSTMGGKLGQLEIDVEDTAATTLECHRDNRRVVIQVHHSFLQRPASRTCEIIGERGTIRLDLRENSIRVDGAMQEQQTFTVARNQLFLDELRQFLDAMTGKGTPVVTVRDAVISLRVALAAKASLASGQVVALA